MASQLLLLQLCLLSLLLATSRQSSCQTLRMLLPRTLLRPGFAFLKLPVYRLLLGFTLLYWLAIDWARTRCWRDPTSAFFAEDKAYEPAYSILRGQQANAFIDHADNNTLPFYFHTKASAHPTICVGITSVARKDANYLQGAVGSVLEGLTVWERGGVYLIVLIAHSNPAEHPAYTEPWLHTLTDKVLLYDPDIVDIERIRELETPEAKTSAREKGLLDYVYLLRACESLNASYTMMLEDDVIALDGWYHRTKKALSIAEKQTIAKGMDQWLYLRLFYTEQFLGWNSEEWPTYLLSSILAALGVVGLTAAIRYYRPATTTYLSNKVILVLTLVIAPLLILLFFAAGRITMLPIPAGVHEMPKFGCCSQGLVFPRIRIKDLVSWYESQRIGYVDVLTETYADKNNDLRWALTPSVLQHVGSKSSKANMPGEHRHRTVSETIWNFRFEENDKEQLRWEHEQQIEPDV
ncbi:putative UDP-GlcNAc: alpha-1,3-D-mannoside beta-1,4-N-acetylglucosaminyltransferase [Penicillium oxalicum 114-2]|uniref:Putative UDP-GlcNAc: alpha-1,3-D-mannoside beta-1,4-N-acetylglucosaminyltransferase n=1 Tax=Penicillium oxalicum (strain 114-2 / CGMCC 5302) TaxID=933388 RepID=S7ZZ50_PENO1|nr:putative UDP-GlcNAc: alpha-1,3-D-mannoside beta-1,4-N-acetylglucosaminyltransferase [Penicillium oxalicum 114-2]